MSDLPLPISAGSAGAFASESFLIETGAGVPVCRGAFAAPNGVGGCQTGDTGFGRPLRPLRPLHHVLLVTAKDKDGQDHQRDRRQHHQLWRLVESQVGGNGHGDPATDGDRTAPSDAVARPLVFQAEGDFAPPGTACREVFEPGFEVGGPAVDNAFDDGDLDDARGASLATHRTTAESVIAGRICRRAFHRKSRPDPVD